jgi:hypothetical protein
LCLALKWADIDWLSATLRVERAIVRQRVGDVKTVYAGRLMSIDSGMQELLAYSDDVDGRFQRDVNGHSGHVNKVGAQRRIASNDADKRDNRAGFRKYLKGDRGREPGTSRHTSIEAERQSARHGRGGLMGRVEQKRKPEAAPETPLEVLMREHLNALNAPTPSTR